MLIIVNQYLKYSKSICEVKLIDTPSPVSDNPQPRGLRIAGPSTLSVVEGQAVELICSADGMIFMTILYVMLSEGL